MNIQVVELRDEADSALDQFQRDLRNHQREAESLREELDKRESFLAKLSSDKDDLQDQLDRKTLEVHDLRSRLDAANTNLGRVDAAKVENEVIYNTSKNSAYWMGWAYSLLGPSPRKCLQKQKNIAFFHENRHECRAASLRFTRCKFG